MCRGIMEKDMSHNKVLQSLRDELEDMKHGDDGGIHCSLWHVPAERNVKAYALALEALKRL